MERGWLGRVGRMELKMKEGRKRKEQKENGRRRAEINRVGEEVTTRIRGK